MHQNWWTLDNWDKFKEQKIDSKLSRSHPLIVTLPKEKKKEKKGNGLFKWQWGEGIKPFEREEIPYE